MADVQAGDVKVLLLAREPDRMGGETVRIREPLLVVPLGPAAPAARPVAIGVADMNHDGHDDLIVADAGRGSLHLLIGDYDGAAVHFALFELALRDRPCVPAPNDPGSCQLLALVADVDGDHRDDVVTCDAAASHPRAGRIPESPAAIARAPPKQAKESTMRVAVIPASRRSSCVAAWGLIWTLGACHDAAPPPMLQMTPLADAAMATHCSSSFTRRSALVGGGAVVLATNDMDGDGWFDLVTINSTSDSASVLLQQAGGGGEFREQKTVKLNAGPVGPGAVAILDYDGDRKYDSRRRRRDLGEHDPRASRGRHGWIRRRNAL